ncbi:hypothetical protein [Fulvivirga sp.]|uniref:hypothetical protein n=1 Tax=Fulvivirga sp. TaxID=1931237 RepID=UPI0032ED26D8
MLYAVLGVIGIGSLLFYLWATGTPVDSTSAITVKSQLAVSKKSFGNKGKHKPYINEKFYCRLRGVGFNNQLDGYNEIDVRDFLQVRFESNSLSNNALVAYSPKGKKLGYFQHDQRKLVRTLKENQKYICQVVAKTVLEANEQYPKPYYIVDVCLYVGYDDQGIYKVEKQLKQDIEYRKLKDEFKERITYAKELKKTDKDKSLKVFRDILCKMDEFNTLSIIDKKFKLPILEMMMLLSSQKANSEIIKLSNEYLSKSNLTEKQLEKANSYIQKANG